MLGMSVYDLVMLGVCLALVVSIIVCKKDIADICKVVLVIGLLVWGAVSCERYLSRSEFNDNQSKFRTGFVVGCSLNDGTLDAQEICRSKALDIYPDKE